jgi:hypothetical protein
VKAVDACHQRVPSEITEIAVEAGCSALNTVPQLTNVIDRLGDTRFRRRCDGQMRRAGASPQRSAFFDGLVQMLAPPHCVTKLGGEVDHVSQTRCTGAEMMR